MKDVLKPSYFYQNSIVCVRSEDKGIHWATYKLNQSDVWTLVEANEMPIVDRFDTAINNFFRWSETQNLRRADCGCCWNWIGRDCTKHGLPLGEIGSFLVRVSSCSEMEKGI